MKKNQEFAPLHEIELIKETIKATNKLEKFVRKQVLEDGDLLELIPYIEKYLRDWKTKENFIKIELALWLVLVSICIGALFFPETESRTLPFTFLALSFLIVIQDQATELLSDNSYLSEELTKERKHILSRIEKIYDSSNSDIWNNDTFYFSIQKVITNPHKLISIIHNSFVGENKKNQEMIAKLSTSIKVKNVLSTPDSTTFYVEQDTENTHFNEIT